MSVSALPVFLILGAGAVGTYVGGSLALHGYPVVWLVRPHHVARLRAQGIRLSLPFGEFRLPAAPLATTWEEAFRIAQVRGRTYEGLVLAVKGYHLDNLLPQWRAYGHRLPPILSLLNGVGAEETLAQVVGREKVVYGTLLTAVERDTVGAVRVAKFRGMGLEAGHPVSRGWFRIFEAARLGPRLYPDPVAMKWSKLLTNLVANSLSALLDWTPAQVYAHPIACRLEMAQQREALAVMDALGIPVVNLPKTPVRALAWMVRHLPSRLACPVLRPLVAGGRGRKMPSFHRDLHQGAGRTEAAWYHGPVVRYGSAKGVPTPVHGGLLRIWQAIQAGEIPPTAFRHNPRALERAILREGAGKPLPGT